MTDEPKPKTNGAAEPVVVKLRRPIQNGDGDEISELTFREPTAADIERCGIPVNLDFFGGNDTPKMTFDSKNMSAMMATLAAVPPSSIKKMHTRDWTSAAWSLATFFLPDM